MVVKRREADLGAVWRVGVQADARFADGDSPRSGVLVENLKVAARRTTRVGHSEQGVCGINGDMGGFAYWTALQSLPPLVMIGPTTISFVDMPLSCSVMHDLKLID